MLTKLLQILLLVAVFLSLTLLSGCDVIDLDATTRSEPTPPSGVWQAEMDQHSRRAEMREGR